jgi:LysR family glycine cleavage system transcriptional activator
MQRKRRILPTLDFLKGFEAAARHLSFTKAASELFVTQSAVSRQIQSLEEQLGVSLFQRRPKDLVLTEAGETLYRAASEVLRQVREAIERLDAGGRPEALTVTCTVAFASLWLIPRLSAFRQERPGADVRIAADNSLLDLERQRMDVAIRFSPPKLVPDHAIRLFGEEIFPVCAPALLRDRARPLKRPEDLGHHVLLHLEEPGGLQPWVNWTTWLEPLALEVDTAGALRFNQYDQMIQAAVDGQGVALGRSPLLRRLIKQGKLVAPFDRKTVSPRAYYVFTARDAAERQEVSDFVAWLVREAKRDEQASAR